MTKQELKRLSDATFFDNEKGAITAAEHRNFNNKLIDNMVALNEMQSYGSTKKWTVCTIEGSASTTVFWSVCGNSLMLTGEYKHVIVGQTASSIHITNIPEAYLRRVYQGIYCLDLRNSKHQITRIAVRVSVSGSKLTLTSLNSDHPFDTSHALILIGADFALL